MVVSHQVVVKLCDRESAMRQAGGGLGYGSRTRPGGPQIRQDTSLRFRDLKVTLTN